MDILNQNTTSHSEWAPKVRNSKNYLAGIVLIVIVGSLFFWFFVKPKAADLSAQENQLAQLQKKRSDVENSVNKMQQLVSELKSSPKDVAKLDEALPLQTRTLRLNLLVNTLAGMAGVTVRDVNFSATKGGVDAGDKDLLAQPFAATRSLRNIPGTVTVTGSYNNLQAFIKKIESNSRIMDIQNMEISGASQNVLNLKLDLMTYSYE